MAFRHKKTDKQLRSDNIVCTKQGDCALITETTASLRAFRLQVHDYVTMYKC